jgi:predicted enzyme related to lactoylglutathione lyase
MPRPTHFEIPAQNPQQAMDFYSKVFGWKFTKWDGPTEYWLISTGDPKEVGIDGGLLQRRDPAQPCINSITVADIDETIKTIEGAGGKCALPKMPVAGVGWLAYYKDPDGNMFGIMQMDPAAK